MIDRSISAAIPAFNAELYLADAIESVLRQTRSCDECLVIDDGSSDGTEQVARSYKRVRYVRQANGGDAHARNRAIHEASCELIAFLDADDVWLPSKVERQLEVFQEEPSLAMVYTGVRTVDASLSPIDVITAARGDVALRNTLLVEKPYMTGIGSTAMVRTDIARECLFDERLRASADWAFACRVAVSHKVEGIEEPLALYRQHQGPQVHKDLRAIERDARLVWSELFTDPSLPEDLRRYSRRAAANLDLSLAASSHAQRKYAAFLKYLIRASIRRPDRVVAAFWRRYMGKRPS